MNKAIERYKTHYIGEDDTTKIVELMIRTSADGDLPMKFGPFYMAVAKEIPDDLVQLLINQRIKEITSSMKNWRESGGSIGIPERRQNATKADS